MRVFVSSVFRSILSHQIDGVRKEKERLIAAQHIHYPRRPGVTPGRLYIHYVHGDKGLGDYVTLPMTPGRGDPWSPSLSPGAPYDRRSEGGE